MILFKKKVVLKHDFATMERYYDFVDKSSSLLQTRRVYCVLQIPAEFIDENSLSNQRKPVVRLLLS